MPHAKEHDCQFVRPLQRHLVLELTGGARAVLAQEGVAPVCDARMLKGVSQRCAVVI